MDAHTKGAFESLGYALQRTWKESFSCKLNNWYHLTILWSVLITSERCSIPCAIHASHFCKNKNSTSLWVYEWHRTACHVTAVYCCLVALDFQQSNLNDIQDAHDLTSSCTQTEIRRLSWSTNASRLWIPSNYIDYYKTRSNWVCTAVALQQLQRLSPLDTPHETAGPWVLGSRWWQPSSVRRVRNTACCAGLRLQRHQAKRIFKNHVSQKPDESYFILTGDHSTKTNWNGFRLSISMSRFCRMSTY